MNYIVLGHTGLIGSSIFARLTDHNSQVLGLNSSVVTFNESHNLEIQRRKSSDTFKQIKDFITKETIIINCIWGDLSNKNSNSELHEVNTSLELNLIDNLSLMQFKSYVSFGTIYEETISENIVSISSKYVEGKKLINAHLEKSNIPYSWIRVATVFGPNDLKSRIISQLLKDKANNIDTQLLYPNHLMNIYHVDKFVDALIKFISDPIPGSFLAISSSWVELKEVKRALQIMEEPHYISKLPKLEKLNSDQVISIESSSFIGFAKEFNNITGLATHGHLPKD